MTAVRTRAACVRRLLDGVRRSDARRLPRQLILDDDGGLEILLASETEWCRAQSDASASRPQDPADAGWSDACIRPPALRQPRDIAISTGAAEAALSLLLPRFDEVVGGSGSVMTTIPGMPAFGPSPLAGIGLVAERATGCLAWVDVVVRTNGPETEAVLAALASLRSPEPLIMVDWPRKRLVRLVEPGDVQRYARGWEAIEP